MAVVRTAVQQRLWDRPELLVDLAEKGYLVSLQLVASRMRPEDRATLLARENHRAFRQACLSGHLEVAQWLSKHSLPLQFNPEQFDRLILGSSLTTVSWLMASFDLPKERLLACLGQMMILPGVLLRQARDGMLEFLPGMVLTKELRAQLTANHSEVFRVACLHGHLSVAQAIWEKVPIDSWDHPVFEEMVDGSPWPILAWLRNVVGPSLASLTKPSCISKFLALEEKEIRSYARSNRIVFSELASVGDLASLQTVYLTLYPEHRAYWLGRNEDQAFKAAMSGGHLATAQWIWQERQPLHLLTDGPPFSALVQLSSVNVLPWLWSLYVSHT